LLYCKFKNFGELKYIFNHIHAPVEVAGSW